MEFLVLFYVFGRVGVSRCGSSGLVRRMFKFCDTWCFWVLVVLVLLILILVGGVLGVLFMFYIL